jgi:hypothetical protein
MRIVYVEADEVVVKKADIELVFENADRDTRWEMKAWQAKMRLLLAAQFDGTGHG